MEQPLVNTVDEKFHALESQLRRLINEKNEGIGMAITILQDRIVDQGRQIKQLEEDVSHLLSQDIPSQ